MRAEGHKPVLQISTMAFVAAMPVGAHRGPHVFRRAFSTPAQRTSLAPRRLVNHSPFRCAPVSCTAAHSNVTAMVPLSLDMADDTRLSFRFSLDAAVELGNEINELVASFKKITKSAKEGKRVIENSLEYRYNDGSLKVDVECNPNVYPDPFTAQVYVVVDDGTIKVSSQALLTRLIDNVKAYKAALSA